MRVYLDDQPLQGEHASVADAIDAAKALSEGRGHIVIEAHADGTPMSQDMLAQPELLEQIAELRFLSTPRDAFLRVTLADAAEALTLAVADQAHAAQQLHSGHIEEAVDPMNRALGTWAVVRDVVDKVGQLAGVEFRTIEIKSPAGSTLTGAACIEGLASDLDRLKHALTVQDWSAVADLLEYDLAERAGAWSAMLNASAQRFS